MTTWTEGKAYISPLNTIFSLNSFAIMIKLSGSGIISVLVFPLLTGFCA